MYVIIRSRSFDLTENDFTFFICFEGWQWESAIICRYAVKRQFSLKKGGYRNSDISYCYKTKISWPTPNKCAM